jgi:hypothetical protein
MTAMVAKPGYVSAGFFITGADTAMDSDAAKKLNDMTMFMPLLVIVIV